MKPSTFNKRVAAIVDRHTLPVATSYEDALNRRMCISFATPPDAETARLMRASGFSYRRGTTAAWVRPLTANARRMAAQVIAQLRERTPEDNA